MYSNLEALYIISNEDLESILQQVVRKELKDLEHRLTEKSRILTRSEAAKILHCCPNTISEYVKTGRIVNRGKGRKILILESDLQNIKVHRFIYHK